MLLVSCSRNNTAGSIDTERGPEHKLMRVFSSSGSPRDALRHGLVPLLITRQLHSIAVPVLYAHPVLSYRTITPFLHSLHSTPSNARHVRDLTVRASPLIPKSEPGLLGNSTIHPSLSDLLSRFPKLLSFTLRDTIVLQHADAHALFDALRYIRPKKARLEFRLWDLHDSPVGEDLIAATRASIHSTMMRPPAPWGDESAAGSPGSAFSFGMRDRGALGGTAMAGSHRAWLEALWDGREVETPPWWYDPPSRDEAQPAPPAAAGAGAGAGTGAGAGGNAPAHAPPPGSLPSAQNVPFPPGLATGAVHNWTSALGLHAAGGAGASSTTGSAPPPVPPTFSYPNSLLSTGRTAPPGIGLSSPFGSLTGGAAAPGTTSGTGTTTTGSSTGTALSRARRMRSNFDLSTSGRDRHRRNSDALRRRSQANIGSLSLVDEDPRERPGVGPSQATAVTLYPDSGFASAPPPNATADPPTTTESSTFNPFNTTNSGPVTHQHWQSFAEWYAHLTMLYTPNEAIEIMYSPHYAARDDATSSWTESSASSSSGEDRRRDVDGVRPPPATPMDERVVARIQRRTLFDARSALRGPRVPTDSSASTTPPRGSDAMSLSDPLAPSADPDVPTASQEIECLANDTQRDTDALLTADDGSVTHLTPDVPVASSSSSGPVALQHFAIPPATQPLSDDSPAAPPSANQNDGDATTAAGSTPSVPPPRPTARGFIPAGMGFWPRTARARPVASVSSLATTNTTASAGSATQSSAQLATVPAQPPITLNLTRGGLDLGPSHHLAHEMRRLLGDLVSQHWAPTLQALSIVTADPLASFIIRAPRLDLWTQMPVPHIRVQLPRAVNSLAVFKGTKELQRDRLRARRRAGADLDLTPRQRAEINRVVGGDGSGGDLLHEMTRLFEIEVNTMQEMTDDVWMYCGDQLPPQVCRILAGEQEWRDVHAGEWIHGSRRRILAGLGTEHLSSGIKCCCGSTSAVLTLVQGPSYSTPVLEAEMRNPSYSPDTADFDSPTFTFDSLDEDEDMGAGGGEEAGEGDGEQGDTYDAEAAREQMRRIEERRRMKRGMEGEEA